LRLATVERILFIDTERAAGMIKLQPPDWWAQVPVLTGASVDLREVAHQDAAALFELLTDPRVSQYISPPPPSVTAFEGFVEWAHRQRKAGTCICLSVVPRGLEQAIGLFQIRVLDSNFRIAEWGFAIGASFWSTGIFEEAAVLVAQFAFGSMGVHRLEARAVAQNSRGNGALEKIGAHGEAVLRKAFNRKDEQFLWAMIGEEWTPPQSAARTTFEAAKLKLQIRRVLRQHAPSTPRASDSGATQPFPFFLTGSSNDPSDD
jgi:[ribosomal protein S5]-alanine N-acetyltransferase